MLSVLLLCQSPDVNLPSIRREFRAVWIATVDNIDWPSRRDLSAEQQRRELIQIFDRCHELKMNAVIFQVRPSADALYPSKLEPWSEYLTGRQGTAPNPPYDPLQFAIAESRKRGLELHVWLNPYRALHPAQKNPVHASHISKTNPGIVKSYGKYLWMDPGEPEVQKRSLAVVEDICRRYDVDGVHIDDYFYPYPEKGQAFPDDESVGKYVRSGGRLSRDDWRRKNVDDFVENLHKTIKRVRPSTKFGISPFGIYRPGQPEGIKAGIDQYAELYADARKWLVEGWCDYFSPQLYWPIAQTAQSYPTLLKWWLTQNPKNRHLWVGNFTSRTNPAEGNWKASEVIDQIKLTREYGAGGNIHFSAKAVVKNFNNISSQLRGTVYAEPALPPASPWLSAARPAAPKITFAANDGAIRWTPQGKTSARWWAVWHEVDGKWLKRVIPAEPGTAEFEFRPPMNPPMKVSRVAVRAVDRNGNESPAAIIGTSR